MRFRLLGSVAVETDDDRTVAPARRHERSVLAILLLEADRAVPMSRLCDLLWDGDPPEHATRAVRTYVARLRALLGDVGAAAHGAELRTEHGGYRLRAATGRRPSASTGRSPCSASWGTCTTRPRRSPISRHPPRHR